MRIFSKIAVRKNATHKSKGLNAIIIQISVQECGNLSKLWGIQLSNNTEIMLLSEYCAILTAVTDKVILKKYGEPIRLMVMNAVVKELKKAFCQLKIGFTMEQRTIFFDNFFQKRLEKYAACDSIMGDNDNHIITKASILLVDKFLPRNLTRSKEAIIAETQECIEKSIILMFKTKVYQTII